ncbi:ComEC/Rec2 family competence protein [Brevibacillus daliensis]|uniref:ComEC/Rec2 family competence protein n=1 Tax=Brevibacillus daliensis TaxID=2892995 RepID=UPI001E4CBF43|nr:ComEC/Rec2 family competence protein [Brevibacillus daliensis]
MKKFICTVASLALLMGCSVEGTVQPPTKPEEVAVPSGELEVHFIDVGQGDSTYIKTPAGDDIVIDAGTASSGKVVVDYLKGQQVDDIEVLIATHPDADHIGGLAEVLAAYDVEAVYAPKVSHTTDTYKNFLLAVKAEGVTIKAVKAGMKLPLQDVTAQFLGPVGDYGKDLNAWSAVLHVTHGETSFIFTADAEGKAEGDMVSSGQSLKADVYKVGHHGSDTSSSASFLKAVNPTYAVISAGEGNRYGHPTPSTLDKLKKAGIKTYRTDQQGNVIATSNGKTIVFQTER